MAAEAAVMPPPQHPLPFSISPRFWQVQTRPRMGRRGFRAHHVLRLLQRSALAACRRRRLQPLSSGGCSLESTTAPIQPLCQKPCLVSPPAALGLHRDILTNLSLLLFLLRPHLQVLDAATGGVARTIFDAHERPAHAVALPQPSSFVALDRHRPFVMPLPLLGPISLS